MKINLNALFLSFPYEIPYDNLTRLISIRISTDQQKNAHLNVKSDPQIPSGNSSKYFLNFFLSFRMAFKTR